MITYDPVRREFKLPKGTKWKPIYYGPEGWYGKAINLVGFFNFGFKNVVALKDPVIRENPKEFRYVRLLMRDYSLPTKEQRLNDEYLFHPISVFSKKGGARILYFLRRLRISFLFRLIAPFYGRKIKWVSLHPPEYLPKDERIFRPVREDEV